MSKIIAEYNVKMPDYALCYLINDDGSGLSEADIKIIDSKMQFYYDTALTHNASVIMSPDMEDGSYFTGSPLFGSPCHVYDCKILIIG